MPLLEVDSLDVFYGAIHALKGLSLTVDEGEIVTLIGANGAGKSTTLKTISGLLRPRTGEILFAGERIDGLRPDVVVSLGICQSPEGRRVFSRMSVQENLEMGAFQRLKSPELTSDYERVFSLFPRLLERRSQLAGTLSGGEQQMLAIGRALMAHPRLLLLDEPSLGLAPVLVEEVFATIRAINERGTTILLVEQNAYQALQLAHRAYVLENGEV